MCANGLTTKAPRSRSRVSSAAAPTTSCASSASTRLRPSTSTRPSRRRSALPPDQPLAVRARSSSRRCSRPAPAQVPPPRTIRPRRPPQTERPQAAHRGEPTPHRSSCRRTASPSTQVGLGAPRAPNRHSLNAGGDSYALSHRRTPPFDARWVRADCASSTPHCARVVASPSCGGDLRHRRQVDPRRRTLVVRRGSAPPCGHRSLRRGHDPGMEARRRHVLERRRAIGWRSRRPRGCLHS